MSHAKMIIDLLNQNESNILEETAQIDERKFDFFETCNLYESAPPSAPQASSKRDVPLINPSYSAPLLAESTHDDFTVTDMIIEENESCKMIQNCIRSQKSPESPNSEISGIQELSSSPIRFFSDSSVSWLPDSEEDCCSKKTTRVYVAKSSSSSSDSENQENLAYKSKNRMSTSTRCHLKKVSSHELLHSLTETTNQQNLIPSPCLNNSASTPTLEDSAPASSNGVGLTRWKKCDPSKWKKNIAESKKQNCLPYIGKTGKLMPAKKPKPVKCYIKCRYQCENTFSAEERQKICEAYWKIQDYNAQKQYLLQKVVTQPIKTMKVGISKKRNRSATYEYYFDKEDDKIRVCKDFFLKTLCISNGPVNGALKYKDELGIYTGKDRRGSRAPVNKTSLDSEQKVIDHINSFPRLESHYCRKTSKRQYLDSKLSISKMYELYKEQLQSINEEPCSFYVYKTIFGSKFNLSFFTPKKDLCITCTRYESSGRPQNLKEEYESHIKRKNEAQQAKESDKQRSFFDDNYLVVTADMQSTLHIPVSGVGILYYVRKLNVQNYTIYTAKPPHKAYCITWNEINGKKGSVEIASAMEWWFKQIPTNITEVTIYSDTCAGQNRNQFITSFMVHLIQRSDVQLQIIELKYLESGHTHMEVDSMHSAIERQQRHTPIYSMIDWKSVMERARSKRNRNSAPPYVVKELTYSEMVDVRALNEKIAKNTTLDNQGKKIKWLKIKCLRFEREHPGLVKFRYQHDGPYSEFNLIGSPVQTTLITRKRKKQCEDMVGQGSQDPIQQLKNYKIPQAYTSPLPISEAKKKI